MFGERGKSTSRGSVGFASDWFWTQQLYSDWSEHTARVALNQSQEAIIGKPLYDPCGRRTRWFFHSCLLSLKPWLAEPPRWFAQPIQTFPSHLRFNSFHLKGGHTATSISHQSSNRTDEGTTFHKRSIALNSIFPFLHNIFWRKHSSPQKSTGVAHVCCKSAKSSSNLKAFSRKPHSSPSKRS